MQQSVYHGLDGTCIMQYVFLIRFEHGVWSRPFLIFGSRLGLANIWDGGTAGEEGE